MGRPRKAPDEVRRNRDVWLSDAEWTEVRIQAAKARMSVSAFARRVLLRKQVTALPPVENFQAWKDLARTTANLNQLTRHANQTGVLPDLTATLAEIRDQVERLRADLIGADIIEDEDDREAD